MKTNWFGLAPVYQILHIYKNRRKVESIKKTSTLEKDNEKDDEEDEILKI